MVFFISALVPRQLAFVKNFLFKFQALEHLHACHCTLFSAPCRNVAEGHMHKCLIIFSIFTSSLSAASCYFMWAFPPISQAPSPKRNATLRKGAAFTFGFLLRCAAAHWTFHFSFLWNSLVSQHQATVKGQVSVFACEASSH